MRLRQRATEKINEEEEMDLWKMFLFVCFVLFPNDSTRGVDSNLLPLHDDISAAEESVVVVCLFFTPNSGFFFLFV